MSLDGLRAWIGEVERKLGKRTRVFLALAVIAIGIGGAAIYLAIDARDNSVSENDVRALQEELEARLGTGGGGAAATATITQLEAELETLKGEVAGLRGESGASRNGKGGGGAGSSGGGSAGGSAGGGGTAGGAAIPIPEGVPNSDKIQELLEQAQENAEDAE